MAVTEASFKRVALEALAFLTLAVLWAGLRILPAHPVVFPDGNEVVLIGNDPWFHLHQTEGAIEHFPHPIRWDVGTHYPRGSRVAAAGLFNLGAAAVSLVLGGVASAAALAPHVLAWSPVVLGALSLLFLHLLAREIAGPGAALLTLLIRILFPGEELERTLLGFGDYHAAEILLSTAGLWTLTRWFSRIATVESARLLWQSAAIASFPLALFQFVWFGAPLHVAVTLAAFWAVVAISAVRSEGDPKHLTRTLPCFLWLLGLTAATGWLLPDWIMAPSGHRQVLVALCAQCLLVIAAGSLLPWMAGRLGRIAAFLIFGLCSGAILFLLPVDHDRLSYQIHHFLSPRSRFVSEHIEVDASVLWYAYGFLLPFLPLGFIAAFSRRTRPGTRFALVFLLFWTTLWIRTSDFGYLVGALLPLAAALGLNEASRLLPGLSCKGFRFLRLLPPIAIALNVLLLIPAGRVKLPFLHRDEVGEMVLATPPWREAMAWIRNHSPGLPLPPTHLARPWSPREGFAYPAGSYGILTHWSFGNLVPTLGRRIAVLARSHSPFYIDWFLETSEEDSLARLRTRGDVRYLVLDAGSVCDSYVSEAMQAGLTVDDMQVVEGSLDAGGKTLPLLSYGNRFRSSIGAKLYLGDGSGMKHHRLVHESREESFIRYRLHQELEAVVLKSSPVSVPAERAEFAPLAADGASWTEEDGTYFCYSGQLLPTVKIYERVAGASLVGFPTIREPATLELELRSTLTGRTFVYRSTATPGDDGSVRFTLPYPTTRETGATIRATGPCRITLGDRTIEVEVDETSVREGATIPF